MQEATFFFTPHPSVDSATGFPTYSRRVFRQVIIMLKRHLSIGEFRCCSYVFSLLCSPGQHEVYGDPALICRSHPVGPKTGFNIACRRHQAPLLRAYAGCYASAGSRATFFSSLRVDSSKPGYYLGIDGFSRCCMPPSRSVTLRNDDIFQANTHAAATASSSFWSSCCSRESGTT